LYYLLFIKPQKILDKWEAGFTNVLYLNFIYIYFTQKVIEEASRGSFEMKLDSKKKDTRTKKN
jgi:hypothetical protein